MSRKSKRRRNRFDPASPNAPIESAAFEFVDDRAVGATAADFVVTGGAAPAASESVNAVSEAPAAPAATVPNPVAAPAPTAVHVEPVAPVVPQPTLGEVLASAREARGLTLEEASARTRISIPTLRNLEGDRFEEMVAAAYARGFLRNYGAFLRLDVGKLLQQYDAMVGKQVEAAPEVWEPTAGKSERSTPRWAAWVAVAMGIAVAAGGVVYGVRMRQGTPLGTGAGLQQIEEELRASQVSTPEAAAVAPSTPTSTSVEANAAAEATAVPMTIAPVPEALEARNSLVAPVEDTAAPAERAAILPPAAGPSLAQKTPASSAMTAEVQPPVAPPGPSAEIAPASQAAAKEAVTSAAEDLVLTVTARDSCALRLQIDADARHAQRYHFAHPGETRSWSARRSFRLLVQRGQHLEVRLNGKLMTVPEGRTLVLDRTALAPAVRPARRSKKTRPATVAKTPPPPVAASATSLAPTVSPSHAAGPPPH